MRKSEEITVEVKSDKERRERYVDTRRQRGRKRGRKRVCERENNTASKT